MQSQEPRERAGPIPHPAPVSLQQPDSQQPLPPPLTGSTSLPFLSEAGSGCPLPPSPQAAFPHRKCRSGVSAHDIPGGRGGGSLAWSWPAPGSGRHDRGLGPERRSPAPPPRSLLSAAVALPPPHSRRPARMRSGDRCVRVSVTQRQAAPSRPAALTRRPCARPGRGPMAA